MSKKAMMNKVYKNYIFDFYGTLVDILTDEKDPALWDKLAQLYQAYGADYKGEGLRKSYAKRVASLLSSCNVILSLEELANTSLFL